MKIDKNARKPITAIFFVAVMLVSALAVLPITGADELEPDSIALELEPCELHNETKTACLEEYPPLLDVAFVFDVTGSMSGVEDTCKEEAEDIKYDIKTLVDDTAFAVAWFSDYPGSYNCCGSSSWYGDDTDSPWTLSQDITTDLELVDSAIDGLPYMSGADWPEDYTRALYETEFLTWREGALKVVLMFGDAPTHDCDFYDDDVSFGCDPGPDATADTGDDLDFETVVAELADENIIVCVADCSGGEDYAVQSFEYMADGTGGIRVEIDGASNLTAAIVDMVEAAVQEIEVLTLDVEPDEYAGWVTWTPSEHTDVPRGECREFEVTYHVPEGTDPGDYEFAITLVGDGVVLATQEVTIDVPEINQPPDVSEAYPSEECLWPPNQKFVDITIEGVTDPDGDEVTITINKITSDEPTAEIKGAGGDKHAPDAEGVGTDTASVRAERSGTGNGRVYEITFVASDGIAETVGSVFVKVPHDQSDDCESIDDGQIYDATTIN